jgi:hypothetical protein
VSNFIVARISTGGWAQSVIPHRVTLHDDTLRFIFRFEVTHAGIISAATVRIDGQDKFHVPFTTPAHVAPGDTLEFDWDMP